MPLSDGGAVVPRSTGVPPAVRKRARSVIALNRSTSPARSVVIASKDANIAAAGGGVMIPAWWVPWKATTSSELLGLPSSALAVVASAVPPAPTAAPAASAPARKDRRPSAPPANPARRRGAGQLAATVVAVSAAVACRGGDGSDASAMMGGTPEDGAAEDAVVLVLVLGRLGPVIRRS